MNKTENPPEVFEAMKQRILRNDQKEFGGAFVIIAPNKEVVSYAAFDPAPDMAAFWAYVQSVVQTSVAEVMSRETQMDMMRRGGR